MHQTIYIDVDEEITSILDRVRQEQVMDIFLVVPKGAMLLNSIINLKLLKKESEKMGKTVTIVAPNDKRAKTMIERAGIKAEDYNKRMNEQRPQMGSASEKIQTTQIDKAVAESVGETQQQIKQGGLDVGSTSFFSKETQTIVKQSQVGDNLSSEQAPVKQTQAIPTKQDLLSQNNNTDQAWSEYKQSGQTREYTKEQGNMKGVKGESFREGGKHSYFNNGENVDNNKGKGFLVTFFRKKTLITSASLFIVVLLGAMSWYMINYPKLTLVIYPLKKDISQEVKLTVQDGLANIDIDEKNIPGEYLESSLEKTLEFDATGSKVLDKNGAKAKGVVTILNYFSDKPQPLVKTTRVLSKSGKLFRLTKGVTVPGMDGEEPGKIEAFVQADRSGEEFNISKDEFTIEGFKGGPKYEKFKVTSSDAMAGGITSTDSKTQKVVSETDLDKARKDTLKALDDSLEEEISKRLDPDQEVVGSSVEKEIISNKSSHLVDTIADKFSYTIVYKIKVVAFYKDDMRQIVEKAVQDDLNRNYQLDTDFTTEIKRGIVDLDKKTLTVYVNTEGIAWFEIDKTKLKESIAGADSEETKKALNKDAGIQSAEIKPSPSWSTKVPSNLDKITIEIIKKP